MKVYENYGPFIETESGGRFYPARPDKSNIHIHDIAAALSRICRFNGHTRKFYSVGEHSVLLARWCQAQNWADDLVLQALLHDAGEAYLGDVAKPLKSLLPDYQTLERACDIAVWRTFGFGPNLDPAIKKIDFRILLAERQQAMPDTGSDWGFGDIEPLDVVLQFWSPHQARAEFLKMYWELSDVLPLVNPAGGRGL